MVHVHVLEAGLHLIGAGAHVLVGDPGDGDLVARHTHGRVEPEQRSAQLLVVPPVGGDALGARLHRELAAHEGDLAHRGPHDAGADVAVLGREPVLPYVGGLHDVVVDGDDHRQVGHASEHSHRSDGVSVCAATTTLTVMCLLVVVSRLDAGAPLVVGANRDERLDRPALAMTVLRDGGPRILGGRDQEAGGTWLAVNEHGVVAGLTNRPLRKGATPPSARAASSRWRWRCTVTRRRRWRSSWRACVPADYNPAWLLVGDRASLYAVDMTGGASGRGSTSYEDRPRVEELAPGVHILENNPLDTPSPKKDNVRGLLGDAAGLGGDVLLERVRSVLGDHSVPVLAPNGRGPGRRCPRCRGRFQARPCTRCGPGVRTLRSRPAHRDPGGLRAHRDLRHAFVDARARSGLAAPTPSGARGRRPPVCDAVRRRHPLFGS